jgi:hypothetical protein
MVELEQSFFGICIIVPKGMIEIKENTLVFFGIDVFHKLFLLPGVDLHFVHCQFAISEQRLVDVLVVLKLLILS